MTKTSANIIISDEKLKAFSLKSGTRQGCPLSTLLFNIVLEVRVWTIRQHKKIIKVIQIKKEKQKCHFLQMTKFCIYKTLMTPWKTIRKNKKYNKVTGYKIKVQKYTTFLYNKNETSEK